MRQSHHGLLALGDFVCLDSARKLAQDSGRNRAKVFLHDVHFERDFVDDMRFDATLDRYFDEKQKMDPSVDNDGLYALGEGCRYWDWFQQIHARSGSILYHILPRLLCRASQADVTQQNGKRTATSTCTPIKSFQTRLSQSSTVKFLRPVIDLIFVGSNSFARTKVTVAGVCSC